MPKYLVEVVYTQQRVIGIWARDEEAAMAAAAESVSDWDNVIHAQSIDVIKAEEE